MSYDQKIQFVRETIEAHNSNVEDTSKIDFDKVMEGLRNLGATTDATLKGVTWEDLTTDCGIPKAMARTIAHHFRQDGNGSSAGKSAYVSDKKAKMMTYKELLERYNPKDSKSSVAKRLNELSDGKPFIVFDKDNRVIVDKSVKLLEDVLDCLPVVETTHVDNVPTPVYKVGERPDFYLDENPLYPEEVLRSGETCSHTGRSWQGISTQIRQLLYLAVDEGELTIETPSQAIDVIDRAIKSNMKELRGRYPTASLRFDELSQTGELPRLKLKIGDSSVSGRKNNPFSPNRTY